MKFRELKIGDIFVIENGNYYIKAKLSNGFNSIILTEKEVDCCCFDNNTDVVKF